MNAPDVAPPTRVDVVRSEWTKLRTLRSTAVATLTCVLMGTGLVALMLSGVTTGGGDSSPVADQLASDPTGTVLGYSVMFAQLAIMVLGALVITGEHATAMIQPSLAAVPRRTRLLAAKCIVFAVLALVVGSATGFASHLLGQALLGGMDVAYDTLGQPHVSRAVLGTGLYLMVVGLLSVAVGTLLRATAGGIATMVAGGIMLPNFFAFLPDALAEPLQTIWPTVAGLQITAVVPDPDVLGPWAGFAVMCAFVAPVLALAFAVFQHRDV